jgi:co-chaperonin GroES (HSP10)
MRTIKPLGEQIIIKALPPDRVGSIIIPDSAKAITKTGESSLVNQLNFVEAEVIAVGTGKRAKDPGLVAELIELLEYFHTPLAHSRSPHPARVASALHRARNGHRVPFSVKPGDRILFHPSVQRFDRKIDSHLLGFSEGEFYIIREESILAVLDEYEQEQDDKRSATLTASAPCGAEVS